MMMIMMMISSTLFNTLQNVLRFICILRNPSEVSSAASTVRASVPRHHAATSPTNVCCRFASLHGVHRNGNIRTVTSRRPQKLTGGEENNLKSEVLNLLSNGLVHAKRCFILIVCYSRYYLSGCM
jgi:hypothetical protein